MLEIVITVVITAILSAVVIQAMGTNVQRSAAPLVNVRSSLSLQEVMENITADYKQLFITDAMPMTTFQNRIMGNNSADGPYWTPYSAFSGQIDDREFTTFFDCDSVYAACFDEHDCNSSDCSTYRVTITQTSTGRSLSALFSQ